MVLASVAVGMELHCGCEPVAILVDRIRSGARLNLNSGITEGRKENEGKEEFRSPQKKRESRSGKRIEGKSQARTEFGRSEFGLSSTAILGRAATKRRIEHATQFVNSVPPHPALSLRERVLSQSSSLVIVTRGYYGEKVERTCRFRGCKWLVLSRPILTPPRFRAEMFRFGEPLFRRLSRSMIHRW